MASDLKGCRVAVLATDGVELVELTAPVKVLKEAGATVHVVAPKPGRIQGWNHHDKGEAIRVDRSLDEAEADQYDALLLPGGVINPDALRLEPKAIAFIRAFVDGAKPIAAICHGPWTLIDAGAITPGVRMTSWPSLKADLTNAGAVWVDEEVVQDGRYLTARKPDDLPAFCARMVELFAKSCQRQTAAR